VPVCVRVCVYVREKDLFVSCDRVPVCVCEREREREREREHARVSFGFV